MQQFFSITLICLCIFSLNSCRKLRTFEMDYSTLLLIPSQTGINLPFNFYSPNIVTNSKARFESEGTSTKYVNTIFLSHLKLTVTNPSTADFDFLNEVQIFISTPNQSEVLIAEKKNIPEEQLKSIICDLKNVNLKDYISDEYYELRIRTVTNQINTQDITIRADQQYTVEAKIR